MKLSDYVMRFVAAEGVRHVFLVTGGGAVHLNASLAQCRELEAVCNSHEQASAMAAESYSKATNNLGVALVTTGPGGANALTGVTGAWLDSTPMLVISGQVKRPDRMFHPDGSPRGMRQLGVQEVDIVSIVKPVTKYAVTVLDPATIRYHLEKAVWLARHGRPGPVWIDIPLDVQASPIEESKLAGFDPAEVMPAANCDLPAKVREAIDAFQRSQRPLLLVGNGVRLARAEDDFRRLFARLGIPVEATWCAADIVSSEDPLFVGRPGSLASRGANFALQNCDFLLIVGARMDFAITGYAPERLARAAHKVMVDIDAAEIRKLSPHIQTEIVADAGDFLREMLRQTETLPPREGAGWHKRCADWKTRYPVVLPEHRGSRGKVSIFHLAEAIGEQTSPEDVLVSGSAGSGIEIFLFACPTRTGQRIYHMAGLGAMGCGIPMSIGACLAAGGKRTICVDGDGGFQFNIQELATVRHRELPIKFFVLNNDGYASIRASQTAFFGSPQVGCDGRTGLMLPPLAKVAEAYGIPCVRIATQERLAEQVREVIGMPGPVLCDVEVIPDEARVPRLSSMQRPDGSLVSKPLEDLFPFLDRDEFYANMLVRPVEDYPRHDRVAQIPGPRDGGKPAVKVLLTGAGGFIGRNLAESLRPRYELFAPARTELDLLNEDAVREYLGAHHFDAIVHAATVRANRRLGAPPGLTQQNCRMFFNLARDAEAFGRLLFLNSGAVYDRRTPVARMPETGFDRSVPADPYGFGKYVCAQHIVRSNNLFDLRLFGVFGPHEDWQVRFLSNACCRAVWDLPVHLKQNACFDYLDVADLAQLIRFFIDAEPRHRAYNVCTGQAIDLAALARKVVRASGKDLPVWVHKPGLGDEYSGDNRRLMEELPGFRFRHIDDSIHLLYHWYNDRKSSIDPALLRFDEPPARAAAAAEANQPRPGEEAQRLCP